ncbi:myelin p0 related [Anaeramoeba flamelloides]|uniref:Myelin p0 related n=1 Tax=Anaeramoeba flamelloides TaxID=1746091 RepID=A0ABQ8XYK5_9EUKA|nr:myelin p0 related [Anaeramoeba flamelloides]
MNKFSLPKILTFVPFLILISILLLPKIFATKENTCPHVAFGDEYRVNNSTSGGQSYPNIASIGYQNEKYVIVWSNSGGYSTMSSSSPKQKQQNQEILNGEKDDYGIHAQIFNSSDDSKIGNEFQVNNYTDRYQNEPRIASIGTNNERFVVVWQSDRQDGSGYGVIAQIFNSSDGTKIGNEFVVNNYTTSIQREPSIASIGTNNEKFVIVWKSYGQDGAEFGIFAQMYNSSDGSLIGKEFLVNNHTQNSQDDPSIASIGSNNEKFVITWYSKGQDGSEFGIFAQMYNSSDGSRIGKEFQVNNYTTLNQYGPRIASIGNNNEKFVITWSSEEQDGSEYGIFAQMFNSSDGSRIGLEFHVNNYTQNSQYYTRITSMGTNKEKFVITWSSEEQDGSENGIFAQIFNSSDGSTIGLEFQVNNYTTSYQTDPSIASIGNINEKFVITWESYGQDGSGNGIYAQNYQLSSEPEINKQIPQTQYYENKNSFNYQFSNDTFQNSNNAIGSRVNLIYEAQLSNGNDLPNGLYFDSDQRKFSGNVSVEVSCQNFEIEIFAINQCDQYTSQTFTLLSSNEMPQINNPIPDQVLSYGNDDYSDYQFQIPEDSFFDNEENELDLNYKAKLFVENNQEEDDDDDQEQDIPEWLIFNEDTKTFTINEDYQLTRKDMGNYTIKVFAIDYCNLNNSQSFNFEIKNDSPYLNKPINDLELNSDDGDDIFIYIFEEDTFVDPNNDQLSYTIYFNEIEDYLPCWIKFIEKKRKFIFDVESADAGYHTIKIKASDDYFDTFDEFNLRVIKKSSVDTDNDGDEKNDFDTGMIIAYSINGFIFLIIIISIIILFKKKKSGDFPLNSSRKKSDININIDENKSDDIIMSGGQDIEMTTSNNNNQEIDNDDDNI